MKSALIAKRLLASLTLLTIASPAMPAAEPEVQTQTVPQTQLYIRTIPPDAKVQINGRPRGTAPLLITLPPEVGKVLLEIELDGFASRKREIVVDGGRITRVELKLREQTQPAWAVGSAVMATRSGQDAEPKLGRLDLRLVPTRDASKTHIGQADIDRYVEQLGQEGPFVGRDRGDPYGWYQLRCTGTPNHITAEHEGRRFILLSNRPAEVMLVIGWNVGPWKLHGIMATEDHRGLPSITIEMDELAGNRLKELTGRFLNSQLAMLVDEQVVSMPTIRGQIGRRIQITGRFTYEEVEKLVKALRSSVVPPQMSQTVTLRDRHFVRLVVGMDQLTFQGQETTWDELPKLLGAVPDRAHTVLEIAIASDEISVGQRNSARNRASRMAHGHGFEYPSDIGVHPLGSKGTASQKVPGKGNHNRGETDTNRPPAQPPTPDTAPICSQNPTS